MSAEHGLGTHDLIEAIENALPDPGEELGRIDPTWVEGERRRSRERPARSSQSAKAAKRAGRLHFLGNDMPNEAMTSRGPEPQEWDLESDRPTAAEESVIQEAGEGTGDDTAHDPWSAQDPWLQEETSSIDGSSSLEQEAWRPGLADPELEGRLITMEGTSPEELPRDFEPPDNSNFVPRIALLGRPNVGKSTLLNQLLGFQRSITSPEAGTTHDTVDAVLERDGQRYVLIDTAGIRRKSRVHERVEKLTVGRAIRTVEAAHMCVLLLDATEGVTEQEAKLGSLVADRGRGLIIVVNKWDLMSGGRRAQKTFEENLQWRFPHLAFAETLFVSALTGRGVKQIWEAVTRVDEAHRLTVRTSPLNRWARATWEGTPPPMHKHRPVRLYYCAQTGVRPPTFVFFCNQPKALHSTYRRFIVNQLRAQFPTRGTPIRIAFKSRDGS
ncbi:MAG: ribosome biogenesis GTPase Der [Deltaproteobacteria bacterium]|nr:ribosome biogenesis GTPase Der [Deltaproteobacteria bacterium]